MSHHIFNRYSDLQDFKKLNPEEKILFRTLSFRLPEGKSPETVLTGLKQRMSGSQIGRVGSGQTMTRVLWTITSFAASIILLSTLGMLISFSGTKRISSEKGSHVSYSLSDGSEINLNSESKISFSKKNFGSSRRLNLYGEAFFKVKTGNPFTVKTPNGTVTVLGTSFNVFSRDKDFKVACLSGEVMVTSMKQSVTIASGESAMLNGEKLIKYQNDKIKYITGWLNGEFYFENTPLYLVFNEIERQYNVKFVGMKRVDEYFTGSFVNKDLRTALEIVCIPMGLEYEIRDNGKVSVSKKHK